MVNHPNRSKRRCVPWIVVRRYDSEGIAEVYCGDTLIGHCRRIRARFGGSHHPVQNGHRFDFIGSPVRDPIIEPTIRELRDRIDAVAVVTR